MKQKNHKLWKYGFLLFLFCIPAIYLLQAYSFLSISRPVKPDILVVEGWLSEDMLTKAKDEFTGKPYKLLITTGFPYWNGFQMGQDGKIVFKTSRKVRATTDSLYTISLTIRGTQCEGEFSHYKLFADTVMIGDRYSTRQKITVTSKVKLSSPPDSIIIEFDNDAYTSHSDRNLYIYAAGINDLHLPANSNKVLLYGSREGMFVFRRHLNTSTAADAASYLISEKLPDSLVITVETNHKKYSKTYTSAMDVKQWLDNNHMGTGRSVTVFTMGPHARRSLACYRKAFDKSAETGVIASKDKRITSDNWYKTLQGWKEIIYETAGLVYISFVIKP
jgi:hypothetical protein